jgi:hypothetical protein
MPEVPDKIEKPGRGEAMMNLGELWIDGANAASIIETLKISDEAADHLKFFMENGYTIFQDVVPDEVTDAVAEEMTTVAKHPERYVVRRAPGRPYRC